jgi:cellulose synthase/poly-beta-1,6-N-acetylglucosamine synthase-like glycosyltransferase
MAGLIIGWFSLRNVNTSQVKESIRVSILIPCRNEALNLPGLLEDFNSQNYPHELMEIIIIDDHSTDETLQVVKNSGSIPITLLSLTIPGIEGKKNAIEAGVRQANGEIIITTDADCHPGPDWVRSIVSFYGQSKPGLILSPVRFNKGNTFFQFLQEMEFMSLQFTTAGSAALGIPLMANGANLAYPRELFLMIGGYSRNKSVPSGDDVFLMNEIKKNKGAGKIQFLRQTAACVQTQMETSWKGFFSQRLRWISKTRDINDPAILSISALVFLVNLALVILCFSACISPYYLDYLILFYTAKLLTDLVPFLLITHFFNRKSILWTLPFLEPINAFYTIGIGIMGNLRPYTWKGRMIRKG